MAFKDETLKRADAQIRRVNSVLKKAADVFGVNSIQYQQRAERVMAAIGEENTASFGIDAKTGALQVKRNKATLQHAAGRASRSMLTAVENFQSVESLRQKMLEQYRRRQQEPIMEQIKERQAAGEPYQDLVEELRRLDPSYVDQSIKGRKARNQAKKQQEERAIREQAEYYKQLNEDIRKALDLIYELQHEAGEVFEVTARVRDIFRSSVVGTNPDGTPIYRTWNTTEEKEQILRALQEELSKKEHEIADTYETGLGGTILGPGGF